MCRKAPIRTLTGYERGRRPVKVCGLRGMMREARQLSLSGLYCQRDNRASGRYRKGFILFIIVQPAATATTTAVAYKRSRCICSRNALLSEEDRLKAPCIYKALQWAQQAAASGGTATASSIHHEVYSRIKAGGGEPDYVEVNPPSVPNPISDSIFEGYVFFIFGITLACTHDVALEK